LSGVRQNALMRPLAPGPADPGTPAAGAPAFVPPPPRGRVFATARTVRSTDVTPGGRLRFDAFARYLQDAAEDDLADAAWDGPHRWLLRRCAVAVRSFPATGDRVRLATFCSGTGPRWAERTTTLSGPAGDLLQARAVWVAVQPATGEPAPLGPGFLERYGPSAQGHRVPARLFHPPPPAGAAGRDWPLRATDFDPAGHVNNSVHWAAVEDELAGRGWLPATAEVEYRHPVLPGAHPSLITSDGPGQLGLWLVNGPTRLASALLARDFYERTGGRSGTTR
jgi:acyl-ACP thioesterase